jgi:hypothetical protein
MTVGPEDDSSWTFTIHKNLICKHLSFLRKAFTSSYKKGMTVISTYQTTSLKALSFSRDDYSPAADFNTNGLTSLALFGVSVNIMADRLLVEAIQSVAFGCLRQGSGSFKCLLHRRSLCPQKPTQHPRHIYDTTKRKLVDNFIPN